MRFADRADAGRRLAAELTGLRCADVVVAGLPRGGVPVAHEVAQALGAPLDVIVVRKLGVPNQPELAMGAVGEDGAVVLDQEILRAHEITRTQLETALQRERAELGRRIARLRAECPRLPREGRTLLVVDDGVATGSTARVACRVARAEGAAHVVLAVPVGPAVTLEALQDVADELVCVVRPRQFGAVGEWYVDFSPTSEEEVLALLRLARGPVEDPGNL